jgi:hypothetical protein
MQVLSAKAPSAVEYVSAAHLVQVSATESPSIVEYVAASQLTQSSGVFAPVAVRYLPSAQAVHTAETTASLYFPISHAVHAIPSCPV